MHQAWCGGPLLDDAPSLLPEAGGVEEVENRMRWKDWRVLAGAGQERDLGGLLGEIILTGPGLNDLWWLLRFGTLLNVGRGAAFGAGRYRLSSH
jgi:CRISPR/Cas system endoribonuclease Cas6 (RAMP superfamily)